MWRAARTELCKELCEKRLYYEELLLGSVTTSLERCVKVCKQITKHLRTKGNSC